MRNHSYENVSPLTGSFSCEMFCKKTRFETEAQGNSEMAHFNSLAPVTFFYYEFRLVYSLTHYSWFLFYD